MNTYYIITLALVSFGVGWVWGRVTGYRAGAHDHYIACTSPSLRERASAQFRLGFYIKKMQERGW